MNLRGLLHRALENPLVYRLNQLLGTQTVRGYRELIGQHVKVEAGQQVLDIGCGIGGFRPLFGEGYCGIDINADYVAHARERYSGEFRQMDCTRMEFADGSFDHAVTIATLHHISDAEVLSTMAAARRVVGPGGGVHIIEPIMPLDSGAWVKRLIFANDRGQHTRTLPELTAVLEQGFSLSQVVSRRGFPHDICYIEVADPLPAP